MPTISELASVYTADISDLEAKHARAMRMVEEFKRASDGSSSPFRTESGDKAAAAARTYAASLKAVSEVQARDSGHWRMIEKWVESEGFKPGRDRDGKIAGFDPTAKGHNRNSAHYRGDALDVSVRGKTGAQVDALEAAAKDLGLIVRDERARPKGQKIWDGAHIHLEWPKGGVPGWAKNPSTLAGQESEEDNEARKARESFAKKIGELADDLNKKSLERFSFWLPGMAKDMVSQDWFRKPYSRLTDKENRAQVDRYSQLLEKQHNRKFIDQMNKDEFKRVQTQLKQEDEGRAAQLKANAEATKAAEEIAKKWHEALKRAGDSLARASSKGTPNERSAWIAGQMADVPSFGMHDYGRLAAYASVGSTYGKTYDANEAARMDKNYADSMRSLTDEIVGFGPVLDSARLYAIEYKDGVQQMTDAQAQQILAEQKYVDAMKKWHDQVTQLSDDATHSVMAILKKMEVSGSHGLGKSLIQTGNAFAREQANKFLSGQIEKGFSSLFGGVFKKPGMLGGVPDGSMGNPLYVSIVGAGGGIGLGGFGLPGSFGGSQGYSMGGGLFGMAAGLAGNIASSSGAISAVEALGNGGSGSAPSHTTIHNTYHGVGNLNNKTAAQIAAQQHRQAKKATGHA